MVNSLTSGTVSCNAGDTATSGGFALNNENLSTKVGDSRPNPTGGGAPTGWYVETTSGGQAYTFDVWAVCEHIA